MDRTKLQEAVTHILTAYLRSHKIDVSQLSVLIANVGWAFSPQQLSTEPATILPQIHQSRRRGTKNGDPDAARIEQSDQPNMFGEAEAVMAEALIGETAGDSRLEGAAGLEQRNVAEPEGNIGIKPGPRSSRGMAVADAKTVVVDGVTVTRIPEVKRRRIP